MVYYSSITQEISHLFVITLLIICTHTDKMQNLSILLRYDRSAANPWAVTQSDILRLRRQVFAQELSLKVIHRESGVQIHIIVVWRRYAKSGVCANLTSWNGNVSVLLRKVKLDAMRYDSFIRCREIKMNNQFDRDEVYSCTVLECQMLTYQVYSYVCISISKTFSVY